MNLDYRIETEAVIIGGGATGSGVLRDCALRGIACILIERDDFASGTTGRNHGLLHSGARYAVTDEHSARECIRENQILKRVANHCIENTQGLFISLPEDDFGFQKRFLEACHHVDIPTRTLDPRQALAIEPSCNPSLLGAVSVPDGTIDPFRLCTANILDAKRHGARVFNHCTVTSLIRKTDRVVGVRVYNHKTQQYFEVYAQQVINAAGIWGQNICEYAELDVKMYPAKGSLLILNHRINNTVINRCRPPADADILVPGDTISLIGTTSEHIDYSEIDHLKVTPQEVDTLLTEGAKLAPSMRTTRVLRAYAGVRPLVSLNHDQRGRDISRGIVLLDHEQRDGLTGLTTITGGKLMTYRLMAEQTTDIIAKKLNNTQPCLTKVKPLPGSESTSALTRFRDKQISVFQSAEYRHGAKALEQMDGANDASSIICECEMITSGELNYAIQHLDVRNLIDLRRRTRLGMGPCQGEMCTYRAANLLSCSDNILDKDLNQLLCEFLEERWKGVTPILWGDALREAEFSQWTFEGLMGISRSDVSTNEHQREETL
ncbi:anaerobic glycerol-3-phosphate dehydrogenase subunit A [Vibrio nomapromontoriensis]|uniref:anaerobic glycerol-3-phosphate dehydrogenase subunit A n=1 Tax=Vibrio nomapromontoriensis TaxID=2910246 RepID=UPI003D0BF9FF